MSWITQLGGGISRYPVAFCHPTVPGTRAEKGEKKKKPYQALRINESHISILGLSAYKGCFSRVLVGNSVLNLTATNYREKVVVFQIQHILKLSL